MVETVSLPSNTFAVMVHKLYVERIKHFLYCHGSWNNAETAASSPSVVQVLDMQKVTGVSRHRKGFVLLLMESIHRPVESLPPMTRQNLSWAGGITHSTSCSSSEDSTDNAASRIWSTMVAEGYHGETDTVRVDVYPRDKIESICLALQTSCCKAVTPDENPEGPFDGPVKITMSASNCTHRLTVIVTESKCYWGLTSRQSNSSFLEMKMNQQAAGEIGVEPADSTTGKELKVDVDVKAPLSRAYYKLDQVWQDFLEPLNLPLSEGSAVDIGACPGGWTQVLVHRMGMSQVVSVDPGRPADRILNLPQVTHAHCDMAAADLGPHGPFSIVVCDASWVWIEVMKQLAEMVVLKAKFMLPSAWIITLKVPFKTLGSIQRHIDRIHDTVPTQLNEMKDKLYPHIAVQVRHQIVHLMANADCERTLIAIFEKA